MYNLTIIIILIAAIAIIIYGGITLTNHRIIPSPPIIISTATIYPIVPDSEKNCVTDKTKHIMMIGTTKTPIGGCRWLVDKLMENGSKWIVSGYSILPHVRSLSGDDIPALERFVMTR